MHRYSQPWFFLSGPQKVQWRLHLCKRISNISTQQDNMIRHYPISSHPTDQSLGQAYGHTQEYLIPLMIDGRLSFTTHPCLPVTQPHPVLVLCKKQLIIGAKPMSIHICIHLMITWNLKITNVTSSYKDILSRDGNAKKYSNKGGKDDNKCSGQSPSII